MDYQVWIKEEFGDTYTKVDCGDLAAAKGEIDKAYQAGAAPLLTVEVPYELSIKVGEAGAEKPHHKETVRETEKRLKEEAEREASKGKAPAGEGPGAESKGKV